MNSFKKNKEYKKNILEQHTLPSTPLELFKTWYHAAENSDIQYPNAMALATATRDGIPSMRMVLLKSFDETGFVFYTNYLSRKGKELALNPHASLLFWWECLEHQVRIEGLIEKISPEESDRYFHSRPFDSQLASTISPQSQVIENRKILLDAVEALRKKYPTEIPRPKHWGGYRLKPLEYEFWQGREARLSDRFRYVQTGKNWRIERLAP